MSKTLCIPTTSDVQAMFASLDSRPSPSPESICVGRLRTGEKAWMTVMLAAGDFTSYKQYVFYTHNTILLSLIGCDVTHGKHHVMKLLLCVCVYAQERRPG